MAYIDPVPTNPHTGGHKSAQEQYYSGSQAYMDPVKSVQSTSGADNHYDDINTSFSK